MESHRHAADDAARNQPPKQLRAERRAEALLSSPSAAEVDALSRPKTAPSISHNLQHPPASITHRSDSRPSSPSFSVPRIAIFRDAFSLQSLRARAGFRKTPTLSDLSGSDGAERARRLSSTSNSSAGQQRTASSPNLAAGFISSPEPPTPQTSRRQPPSRKTSFGPPPSIITRGFYNSDLSRRAHSPAAQALAQQKNKTYGIQTPGKVHALEKKDSFLVECTSPEPVGGGSSPLSPRIYDSNRALSLDAMMDRSGKRTTTNGYLDDGASAYTDGLSPTADGASGGENEDSGRSAEDLFLNLADDSAADSRAYETQSRLERRLVCLLFTFHTHCTCIYDPNDFKRIIPYKKPANLA
jgi:hypothetical protein